MANKRTFVMVEGVNEPGVLSPMVRFDEVADHCDIDLVKLIAHMQEDGSIELTLGPKYEVVIGAGGAFVRRRLDA